ncbi:MAG: zinc ribbon domain-containing protein [Rhodothermales bacterium]
MALSCESCGARLSDGAVRCDICGTAVGGVDAGTESVPGTAAPEMEAPSPVPAPEQGPWCTSCGTRNPLKARFCFACGSALVAVTRAVDEAPVIPAVSEPQSSSASPAPDAPMGRQVAIVLTAAILVVIALYVITTMSRDEAASLVPEDSVVALLDEGPLPEQFQSREAELNDQLAAAAEDVQKVLVHRELVDLYLSAARLDLAARETIRLAELTGREADWVAAGNMYYDWMETKPVAERGPWAKQAISAYRQALELNPSNTDVRTDMAIAYMYDPDNPMMAIQETNAVLEQDSLHIQANFNRGIMLMQINRVDQARAQFEKVQSLIGDPENPIWQRAAEALARLDDPQPQ